MVFSTMTWLQCVLTLVTGLAVLHGSSSSYSTGSSSKKVYKVVSIETPPYLFPPSANGTRTGYMVDLLNAFKADGDFEYTLDVAVDKVYGDYFENKTSTGLINKIQTGQYDIAAADVTITQNRSKAVDFTCLHSGSVSRVVVNSNFNNQTVKYYMLTTASLTNYLNKTKEPAISVIWDNIQPRIPESSLDSPAKTAALVQRLANGENVALVGETPGLIIALQGVRNKVSFLTGVFNTNSQGMAVKLGSVLRRFLTLKILKLSESGVLLQILERYFGPTAAFCSGGIPSSGGIQTVPTNVTQG